MKGMNMWGKVLKSTLFVVVCLLFTLDTTAYAQHVVPPHGWIDSGDPDSCTKASGWACISGDPQNLSIHLYHDSISASTLITILPANQARNEPGFLVNSGCTDINHGFVKAWSQAFIDSMSDGNPHGIYAVAVDNTNAANRTTLSGSPITITCNVTPWWQTTGADVRKDSGILDDMSPFAACGGAFVSLQGTGGSSGMVISGVRSPDLGSRGGRTSIYNWIVGSPTYPDHISSVRGPLHTSYKTALANAKANTTPGVTFGIINSSYTLTSLNGFVSAAYQVNGDLNVNAVINVPAGGSYVFLVSGNTTFSNGAKVRVPVGSFFSIITQGDLKFDPSVGSAAACPPAAAGAADVEGFYSADGNILIQGNNGANNSCTTPDNALAIQGAFVANAGRTGGQIQNTRNLCSGNARFPSFSIRERPDLMLNIPAALKFQSSVAQETTPGQ